MHAGHELKKLRMAEEITQKDLAECLKTNQSYISTIENRENLTTMSIRWYLGGLGLDFVGYKTRVITK
ncbi:MAG: helix-turn-helix transcriptional regulator [Phycisphaerae bacterium]|jgi:transcriptional regulator with XRE-family HTH domain